MQYVREHKLTVSKFVLLVFRYHTDLVWKNSAEWLRRQLLEKLSAKMTVLSEVCIDPVPCPHAFRIGS